MRHVALLRGINVGRAKRIAMADLRAVFEALGYRDVATLLNSGNVVFTPSGRLRADVEARMTGAIRDRLGVTARVIVLSADEVAAIVRANPLRRVATDPSRLMVAVYADPADRRKVAPLGRQTWTPEALAIGFRHALIWCPEGTIRSALFDAVTRALGDAVTTRNWSTMTKLHALAMSSDRRA